MKKNILYLVKFFEEEKHADQIRKGELYLNRISFFKKNGYENTNEDGRPDKNEAISHWFQPSRTRIELSVPELSLFHSIPSEELSAPSSLAYSRHENLHVYCMTSMSHDSIDGLDNHQIESTLRQQIKVNEKCYKFGNYAVITQAKPFLERAKKSTSRKGSIL
jgi:hypothetical protein